MVKQTVAPLKTAQERKGKNSSSCNSLDGFKGIVPALGGKSQSQDTYYPPLKHHVILSIQQSQNAKIIQIENKPVDPRGNGRGGVV